VLYRLVLQHTVTLVSIESTQQPRGPLGVPHLYSLWIKAVWTILGWWIAAAAATGAGMMILSGGIWSPGDGCIDLSFKPLGLVSLSGLFVAEAGAEELVGVVISMGSPGDGADIWMVGVMIGIVLAPIGSSGPSAKWFLGALSVAVAICPASVAVLVSTSVLNNARGGGGKNCDRDPQGLGRQRRMSATCPASVGNMGRRTSLPPAKSQSSVIVDSGSGAPNMP